MKDLTNEDNLILQSLLTVEFLEALSDIGFLGTDLYKSLVYSKRVRTEFSEIGIGNQGSLLMFLYALLVIPKELVSNEFTDQYEIINSWLKDEAASIHSSYTNINELRHIRNAVAHARVEFIPNDCVIFKDEHPKTGATFELKLSLKKVGILINKLKATHQVYMNNRG